MCEICTNNIQTNVRQYDPTRTTTLRNLFARALRVRFNELTRVIRQAIVDRDCFGMGENSIVFQQMMPPGYRAFDFPTSAAKLDAFMSWFQTQIDRGILQTGNLQELWTNKYVTDTYKRGATRARYEMQKAGFDVPSLESTGGISATMQAPVHIDSLQLLYTRVYNELKGITDAMSQQISRVLAQGFADGDNPRLLARKLVSTINGSGMGDLAIKDTLGRFIPARRRAEMLARTEIIRVHHNAMINEYELWAQEENYRVKAEFLTAQDNRVCGDCLSLEGNIYTLDQARGLIPYHPSCRCILLPFKERGFTT